MYALFAGYRYYPEGGWADHRATLPSAEECEAQAREISDADWWHIINLNDGTVVRKWVTDIYDGGGPFHNHPEA